MNSLYPYVAAILLLIWGAICPFAVMIANPVFLFSLWYVVVLVLLPVVLLAAGIWYKRVMPTRFDVGVAIIGSLGCVGAGYFHLVILEYFKHAL
jgi:hypothetical protein